MKATDFIDLVLENSEKWKDKDHVKQTGNLISYCYDVLCSDEEFARVSEELAAIKQELESTKQDLEIYKSGYNRLSGELLAYKGIVKSQSDLINLIQ